MASRTVHWLSLVLVLVSAAGALLFAGWLISVVGIAPPFALAAALALIGIAAIASWLIQEFAWLQPLERLERELRLQVEADPGRRLTPPARHGLGTLPECLLILSRRLAEGADGGRRSDDAERPAASRSPSRPEPAACDGGRLGPVPHGPALGRRE